MGQRKEDFLVLLFELSNCLLDDGDSAWLLVLITQTFKDPLRCVTLLTMDFLVRLQDLLNDR